MNNSGKKTKITNFPLKFYYSHFFFSFLLKKLLL